MFKSGIRSRLIASYVILILVMLSALGGYILTFFNRYNTERLTANLQAEAQMVGQLLRPYMDGPTPKAVLDDLIKDLADKADRRLTVIDTQGVVLADSWENPALMENHRSRPEISTALAGEVGSATRYSSTQGENSIYVAVPMKRGSEITGVLRISNTLAHVEQGFNEIRNVIILAVFLAAFFAVILSLRLTRKFTAPIEEITAVARKMGDGHLDQRVHLRTGDEIEVLGHALNNLASRLDDKVTEIMSEKQKLKIIFENMDNAVILFDRYGRVTEANAQAQHLFRFTAAMIGQHYVQALGTGLLDKAFKETLQQGERQWLDLRLPIQGVKRAFQVFLAPTASLDDQTLGVLTVFHDITALKNIEERQADFVANAAHELGTPLTSIKGYSETLLEGALTDPEISANFIAIIHEEAERMDRLVKDLLKLARIQSSESPQPATQETISLRSASERVINQLSPQLKAKSLQAELCVDPEDLSIRSNTDWLNQILSNLVENSIKFTPAGGKISIHCRQEQDKILISVQDTGIGIPPQDLPFIFDRFYRVDRARARTAGGTGLGLAIVKSMVEGLGGKIQANSKLNAGSTFIITLPIQ